MWYKIFLYASIPLSGGLIGWLTNWLAIQMTFYPIRFWGIKPIGWQGIIPAKSKKMAEKAVDLLTDKLLKIDEQFALIEPTKVAHEMQSSLEKLAKQIVEEAMDAQLPFIWANTSESIKIQIFANLQKELPNIIAAFMADVKQEIHQLLDLKKLSVQALTQNKSLLNEMFWRCGSKEFKFIEISGLYFGIPFGLVQMLISIFYNPWWLLPLFGLIVGYATNWLALKMIFEPRKPKKYLFGLIQFQGLFFKRQNEVADEYAQLITQKILTTENMFEFVVRGPSAERLTQLIQKNIAKLIDQTIEHSPMFAKVAINAKQIEIIKNIASYRFLQELPIAIRDAFAYAEDALDLQNMLSSKMRNLPPIEFEAFLRPAFQEDEFLLILIGAILGCLAGILQYVLLFS